MWKQRRKREGRMGREIGKRRGETRKGKSGLVGMSLRRRKSRRKCCREEMELRRNEKSRKVIRKIESELKEYKGN